MAQSKKIFNSACGKYITEAHYWRNIARELLNKNRGMSEMKKASSIFKAREALTQALLSTEEGRALLAQEVAPVAPVTVIERVENNAAIMTERAAANAKHMAL